MKVVFFVVMVVAAVCGGDEHYFRKLDEITQEPECSAYGGICTFAADCPELRGGSGLCPNQQKKGVECCAGVSVRETRCGKHGGECKPASEYCNPRIIYANASDCGANEKCCILVN